jgi:hypothetical protein
MGRAIQLSRLTQNPYATIREKNERNGLSYRLCWC